MRKEIIKEVEIPSGIEAQVEGTVVTIKGPEGENSRDFRMPNIEIAKRENKVVVWNKKSTKKEKKMINSVAAHIANMVHGAEKKFSYKLKVCYSHFPVTVDIKGKEVIIKNFLGEKIPRKMTLPEGVDVHVNKDVVTVESIDRERAGQVAANFEVATRITKRDRRVFQDGIFITEKPGRDSK